MRRRWSSFQERAEPRARSCHVVERARTPVRQRAPGRSRRPGERLQVTVLVRPRAGGGLASPQEAALEPPVERRYLSRAELAAARGADPADLRAVEDFAAAHDLTVVEANAPGRAVILEGTVAAMNAAFGVDLR